MQLVRTLYGSTEKSYKRKIREAKLAEELENEHSKNWILTKYLNTVPYGTYGGQTALGVWAAAKTYFDKPPRDLTLGQAALLAGLPQAPTLYSPVRSPAAAKERRNDVLDAMAKQNFITDVQAEEGKAEPLHLDMSKYFQTRREDYFFDYVKDELYKSFPAREVRRGGLRVHTTIDPDKQDAARTAIAGRIAGIGPSSAIVTIDPQQRRDPHDGVVLRLRQVEVQPRRPGPPPARLVLQDDGADDRAATAASTPTRRTTRPGRSTSTTRRTATSRSRPTTARTAAR